ncbi:MAG TPA: PCYCGC motif-containing (lipo)protein [Gemmatimonadaceae bacterium]|nr:PCYCGC motif-containing (lipo)protein [Gemmatimonadaceae bacterium]
MTDALGAGETGGDFGAACAQASAKIEHVAASRFSELGTEVLVEVGGIMQGCNGRVKWPPRTTALLLPSSVRIYFGAMPQITRRTFIASGLGAFAAVFATSTLAYARRSSDPKPHPDPRPGITGANVATKEQLASTPALIPIFDDVREIPEIADGIRCRCGCADSPGFRSLLSCYEGADAMARECHTCQGEAKLAARLKKSGKSLDEIRAAIDAKYA